MEKDESNWTIEEPGKAPIPPKRAFEVKISIGSDSWEGILSEIKHIAFHLDQCGPKCQSVMGGPSSNHIIEVETNPEMTHEKYIEALETFLSVLKKRKEKLGEPDA